MCCVSSSSSLSMYTRMELSWRARTSSSSSANSRFARRAVCTTGSRGVLMRGCSPTRKTCAPGGPKHKRWWVIIQESSGGRHPLGRRFPLTRVAGPWKIQAVQARPVGILSCFALIFLFMPSTTVASPGQTTPVDLSVETLRVGGAGTETLSTDEARIFLGKSGVLDKELTLRGRTARRPQATERIRLHAEFRPLDLTPTGLTVAILSQVRVLAVSGGGALPRGEISHAANLEVLAGG